MMSLGERVLWQRTKDYVKRYEPLLIGVTGSTGKTFTKHAVSTALSDICQLRPTTYEHKAPIDVALSIMGITTPRYKVGWVKLLRRSFIREITRLEPDTVVLDLPDDKPGNIDFLANKLNFKIGVVTNVGSAHLRLYGEKNMVAHEKSSLVVSLPEDGYAVLNMDDPLVWQMKDNTKAQVISFGSSAGADVRLHRAQRLTDKGFVVDIEVNKYHHELYLSHLITRQQIYGILASLAVVLAVGGDIKKSLYNLKEIKPLPGRMSMIAGVNGSKILDSSYSASPESTLSALHTLQALPAKRRIAILGDILDLGGRTVGMHQKIGKQVVEVADIFVGVGECMRIAQASAMRSGRIDTHHFNTAMDVGKWMIDHVKEGDLILVKGSKEMKMQEVVRRLLSNPKRDEKQLVR